jgi:hypothetical protein
MSRLALALNAGPLAGNDRVVGLGLVGGRVDRGLLSRDAIGEVGTLRRWPSSADRADGARLLQSAT